MNKLIITLCTFLSVIALKDLYLALFTESTFDDVAGINVNFEVGYYIFGVLVGLLAQVSKSGGVKLIGVVTGLLCLVISLYNIIDSREDTVGKAEDCAVLRDLDKISECFDKLKKKSD